MTRPLVLLAAILFSAAAVAADDDPCKRFAWDVSHELAVMKQDPQAITTASKPQADLPRLNVDSLYRLTLADQGAVTFVVTPGKPTLPDGAHAGIAQFRTDKAGRYRVALTSGHWIDIVDDKTLI